MKLSIDGENCSLTWCVQVAGFGKACRSRNLCDSNSLRYSDGNHMNSTCVFHEQVHIYSNIITATCID